VIDSFKSFIEEQSLFHESAQVLLAVSGGLDSMAMAELFSISGYKFAIAHCNFRLRGEDADADEALVKETAARYGVEFFCRSFDTAKIAEESGDSIQMTARHLRYGYFEEIAVENGFDHIATAHQLDDQIETFFINLARGCGIAGLHGIPIKNGKVVRPMMFAYRNDIELFVSDNEVLYLEDKSNRSRKYIRNRIRHEMMPMFLEINPAFREEMSANIDRLSETEKIYRQFISITRNGMLEKHEDLIAIDIDKLKVLDPLQTFLYELISEYGFKKDDVANIIAALEATPGKRFLSKTHQLLIDRKKILISGLPSNDQEYLITLETKAVKDPLKMTFNEHAADGYSIPHDKQIASLDLDKLSFPLKLRKWRTGDSFIPLGMKNHKKLSDFFIDEKFSIIKKEKTWILCSGEDIVWIVWERISDVYKVTEDTQSVYKITIV